MFVFTWETAELSYTTQPCWDYKWLLGLLTMSLVPSSSKSSSPPSVISPASTSPVPSASSPTDWSAASPWRHSHTSSCFLCVSGKRERENLVVNFRTYRPQYSENIIDLLNWYLIFPNRTIFLSEAPLSKALILSVSLCPLSSKTACLLFQYIASTLHLFPMYICILFQQTGPPLPSLKSYRHQSDVASQSSPAFPAVSRSWSWSVTAPFWLLGAGRSSLWAYINKVEKHNQCDVWQGDTVKTATATALLQHFSI